MTQPSPYPTPPVVGQPPAAGGGSPPPTVQGHAVPAQPGGYAPPGGSVPPPPPGWAGPPGYAPPPGWTPPPGYAPAPVAPNGQPLASFSDRLLAFLIDAALATAVTVVLFVPVLLVVWFTTFTQLVETNPDGTLAEPDPVAMMTDVMLPVLLAELALLVVMLGLYWLYHVEYLHRTGQTLGKRIMKLRVVPLDPARTLDRATAGRRYLVQFVGGTLLPGLSWVDGLWQLWDKPWQQCLHDKFARTVVVKVAP